MLKEKHFFNVFMNVRSRINFYTLFMLLLWVPQYALFFTIYHTIHTRMYCLSLSLLFLVLNKTANSFYYAYILSVSLSFIF